LQRERGERKSLFPTKDAPLERSPKRTRQMGGEQVKRVLVRAWGEIAKDGEKKK